MRNGDRCRIEEIASLLEKRYGPRPWKRHRPPIEELVLTILSQHTSDLNSERAFAQLADRFPTWEAIIAAPTNEVADAIRSGGLAEQKAPRIQAVLRTIFELSDGWNLDFLAGLPVAEGRKRLTSLPGVGPKTASCVLLFSLGLPAMPVDTHVHRVARRLGLIGPKETAEGTQHILEKKVGADRDRIYALHMSLIAHGRAVCIARRPRCGDCPLTRCCDYYLELSADSSNPAPSGQG
jgi:endonuclease III